MTRKTVDVAQVIDSANFFWVPFGIAIMMIVIMLADGYGLFLTGHISTFIVADWKVTLADLQPMNTATMIGMAVGSVSLGWLGDRIGRKRAYIACLVFLSLGSVASYFVAQNGSAEHAQEGLRQLWWWRIVAGLGMGGVTPLATTLIAEWTPRSMRNVIVALVISSVPLAGSLTGLAAKHFTWPVMFLIGGVVPAGLFVLFGFLLPESPKYMAKQPGQQVRLAKSLNRLLGENRFDGTEEFVVQEEGKRSGHWLKTIWNSHYAKATAFIWIAFTFNSFVLYMYTQNLKNLLVKGDMAANLGGDALSLFSIGAFFGSIGGAFLIRWLGSRYVGTGLAILGVFSTAMIGTFLIGGPSIDNIMTMSFLSGVAFNGMQAFMYAVSAHSYPTEIRGSAVGLAQTVSRAGAVLSPMIAGAYLSMSPLPGVNLFLWFVAACAFVTAVSFFLIPSHIPSHAKQK
jgi:MFS transporter, AAHS family, 4-hydroxybenzoate transporter